MKIYDVNSMFDEYGEEICEKCESSQEYYESDTGYREFRCKGNAPEECQCAIKQLMIDYEGEENMSEQNDLTNLNEMELKIDLNSLKNSIVNSIKVELKQQIQLELKNQIVKQIYNEVALPQIEEIKNSVAKEVHDLVKTEIETYYTTKKIAVGGGYSEAVKEYTIQEYTQELLKSAIENGVVKYSKGKYDTQTIQIDKYLIDNCMSLETTRFLDENLKKIQKDINTKVKNVFETKVENMMSEVALGVLKSNSTYNDITKKLLG